MSTQCSSENLKGFSASDPGEFSLHNTTDQLKTTKLSLSFLALKTTPSSLTALCHFPFLPVLIQAKFFTPFSFAVMTTVEMIVLFF